MIEVLLKKWGGQQDLSGFHASHQKSSRRIREVIFPDVGLHMLSNDIEGNICGTEEGGHFLEVVIR